MGLCVSVLYKEVLHKYVQTGKYALQFVVCDVKEHMCWNESLSLCQINEKLIQRKNMEIIRGHEHKVEELF